MFEFVATYASVFARLALGATFLSAVADRLGLWGPPGAAGVAWGDVAAFEAYTGLLNPWLPAAAVPALGWTVTALEVVLGAALILGVKTRPAALLSGALLLAFALAMAVNLGPKVPLDYSVFSAAAAALLLAGARAYPLSLERGPAA